MSVEVIVYIVGAIGSAIAAFFTFRNANRLKSSGNQVNYLDQSGAGIALSILALVLVIFAMHGLGG